jgi:hypothetical protein
MNTTENVMQGATVIGSGDLLGESNFMKTVTIQIGNSDDKLTQTEWAAYVLMMRTNILQHCTAVHFFGAPANWERWQNVAWVVVCEDAKLAALKAAVTDARSTFNQDSAAWTEGETQFA